MSVKTSWIYFNIHTSFNTNIDFGHSLVVNFYTQIFVRFEILTNVTLWPSAMYICVTDWMVDNVQANVSSENVLLIEGHTDRNIYIWLNYNLVWKCINILKARIKVHVLNNIKCQTFQFVQCLFHVVVGSIIWCWPPYSWHAHRRLSLCT